MNDYLIGHKSKKKYQLDEHDVIGRGGEGIVYKIKHSENCLKVFTNTKPEILREKEAKLKFMCNNEPFDSSVPKEQVLSLLWPIELLYNINNKFRGYIMPLIVGGVDLNLFLTPTIPERIKQKHPWIQKFDINNKKSESLRLIIAYNIANVIKLLHESQKYIIVDCKADNFLVNSSGKIFLLDSDSIQIQDNDKILFRCNVITDEYRPFESYNKRFKQDDYHFDQNWDVYTYSYLIYKILFVTPPTAGTLRKNIITSTLYVNYDHSHEYYVKHRLYPISYKRLLFKERREIINKKKYVSILKQHNRFYNLDCRIQKLFLRSFFSKNRPKMKEWSDSLYNSIKKLEHKKNRKPAIIKIRNILNHSAVVITEYKFSLPILFLAFITVFSISQIRFNFPVDRLLILNESIKEPHADIIDFSGNYYGYIENDFSNILYLHLSVDSLNTERYFAELKYNIQKQDVHDVFIINFNKQSIQSKTLGKGSYIVDETNKVKEIIFNVNQAIWIFKK